MEDTKAVEREVSRARRSLVEYLSDREREVARGLLEKYGRLRVCANCAGLHVGQDVQTGAKGRRCGLCNYLGLPLIFTNVALYEKFFEGRRSGYNRGRIMIEPNYLLQPACADKKT